LPGALLHLRLSSDEPIPGWVVALGIYGVLLWCLVYFLIQGYRFPRRPLGAAATLAGLLLHIGNEFGIFTMCCAVGSLLAFFVAAAWPLAR